MSIAHAKRVWRIASMQREKQVALAAALEVPPIVAHLLLLRGQTSAEAAAEFLSPAMAQLSDPMLLTGMDKAVARVTAARDNGESILVFGDYDVDGISATALMTNGLRRFGVEQVRFGLPLRLEDGYGLGAEHVNQAKADGVSLIITVDNGVAAHEAAERAQALGIDLIITDHHALPDTLPPAVACINPRQESPDHPAYNLCGAGVAFKVACALNGTHNDLDIAALGTVADMMPLRDENRAIVSLGLRHMAKHRRNGIACLAALAGFDLGSVTAQRIGFQLGPRLNAAGRLDDAEMSLRLLLTECPDEGKVMAEQLDAANEERRELERRITEEAIEELEAFFLAEQRSVVLGRRGWHPGVIGIVASRLQHRYWRPVVLVAFDENGTGRGSARSCEGFDMVGAFGACREHLVRYGGHRAAAGMTVEESSFDAFREDFEREALRQLGEGERLETLDIDVLASFSQIDHALLGALEKLEPLGQANPEPVFCSMNVEVLPESVRILKDKHLKFTVKQDSKVFEAIGFGMVERFYQEDFPRTVDLAYSPQINTWRGARTIQLVLKDIRPAEGGDDAAHD